MTGSFEDKLIKLREEFDPQSHEQVPISDEAKEERQAQERLTFAEAQVVPVLETVRRAYLGGKGSMRMGRRGRDHPAEIEVRLEWKDRKGDNYIEVVLDYSGIRVKDRFEPHQFVADWHRDPRWKDKLEEKIASFLEFHSSY